MCMCVAVGRGPSLVGRLGKTHTILSAQESERVGAVLGRAQDESMDHSISWPRFLHSFI